MKERVKEWRVERDETIVSYDVVILYPSIPIQKALTLVHELLASKNNLTTITSWSIQSIMKLLSWTFSLFYCEYNNEHYILDSGPIGLGTKGHERRDRNYILRGSTDESTNPTVPCS